MNRIRHRVGIKTSTRAAYEAVHRPERLAGWWAAAAKGETAIGSRLTLDFPGYPSHVWEITELVPDESVVMNIRSGPEPWEGSVLSFDISEARHQVWVTLTHDTPTTLCPEAFQYFQTKWPMFLVSLKALLETGEGMPYPNDIAIQHD